MKNLYNGADDIGVVSISPGNLFAVPGRTYLTVFVDVEAIVVDARTTATDARNARTAHSGTQRRG